MITATTTTTTTRHPRGHALAIVDAVRRCGVASADWCVGERDALWGHLELPDRDAVMRLVTHLAGLLTPIEVDVMPLAHDGLGRWSVKLRAGSSALADA